VNVFWRNWDRNTVNRRTLSITPHESMTLSPHISAPAPHPNPNNNSFLNNQAIITNPIAPISNSNRANPCCNPNNPNSNPVGGSVAEWLACWTQAQKGLGSNRSRDAVGKANCSHPLCLWSPSSQIDSSPLKGCDGNCGPGGK